MVRSTHKRIAEFLAIDVETACADRGSICQLGVAYFSGGSCRWTEARLICPETAFSPHNIAIHGIRPKDVLLRPTWAKVYPELQEWARVGVMASHTFFDRAAVEIACRRYGAPMLPYTRWIDTFAIAKEVWPELANHKLTTLASHFGIAHKAHDAAEDARTAGEILSLALQVDGSRIP